jgi:hypothetical protein
LQPELTIAFTDSPNGGSVLRHRLSKGHNPVLVIGSAQKYLGTTRDPDGSLTITQQLTQESFILGFQFELAGLPTTHNSSPVLVPMDE